MNIIIDIALDELDEREQRIVRMNRQAWFDTGLDLFEIREKRLFRARSWSSWPEYCMERWGKAANHVDEQIKAAKELQEWSKFGVFQQDSLPSSISQAKALALLPEPKQRAEVWSHVLASGTTITAKVVESEVERYKAALSKNYITLEEWNAGERWHGGRSIKAMNEQDDKNIEWAAWSWNPVTGCLHNCNYCYARDIANRFYPYGFQPAFIHERLDAPANTKQGAPRWQDDIGYRNVFTCSMADLFGKWVPAEWIDSVIATAEHNPQWTFLFLTKFPVRMAEFTYPANVWLGTTVDKQYAVERAESAFRKIKTSGFGGVCWLSCEPMLEQLNFNDLGMFDWVVMGGASKSTQTPEMRPPFDDIVNVYEQARSAGCRVYMKTNLGIEQRIREYPDAG
jgi:protein gp37